MKFEAEGDLKLQLDLFLNHGLNLFDNFELPVELGIDTEFNRVEYTWPSSNAAGALVNDGSGTLSWKAKPTVSGARDTPEEALANLLTKLSDAGIITDDTTES